MFHVKHSRARRAVFLETRRFFWRFWTAAAAMPEYNLTVVVKKRARKRAEMRVILHENDQKSRVFSHFFHYGRAQNSIQPERDPGSVQDFFRALWRRPHPGKAPDVELSAGSRRS
jgi:hypothetical protein